MDHWVASRREDVARTTRAVTEITETDALTVSKFSVAASLLGDLARGVSGGTGASFRKMR